MSETEQPIVPSPQGDRFTPRPNEGPIPVRRTNYQLPARPINGEGPAASARPVPAAPAFTPSPPPAPVQPNPVDQPAPVRPAAPVFGSGSIASPLPVPANSVRPLQTPAAPAVAPPRAPSLLRSRLALGLMGIGVLLTLFGAIRWVASSSLNSKIVTLGAVVSTGPDPHNNGTYATKIQYVVAHDGKLHNLYLYGSQSETNLVPGTAVKVAYSAGHPDNSAVEWSVVQSARRNDVITAIFGIILLLVGAGNYLRYRQRAPRDTGTPVTSY